MNMHLRKTTFVLFALFIGTYGSVHAQALKKNDEWTPQLFNLNIRFKEYGEKGFIEVSSPITVQELSSNEGEKYFFAVYYTFRYDASFYMGIQPIGGKKARVLFSVFTKGARSLDPENCSQGADGLSGVSCNKGRIDFSLDTRYLFTAQLHPTVNGPDRWYGYVSPGTKEKKVQIGAWSIPKARGYIFGYVESSSNQGFIEDYRDFECSDITAAKVLFGQGKGFKPEDNEHPIKGMFDHVTTSTACPLKKTIESKEGSVTIAFQQEEDKATVKRNMNVTSHGIMKKIGHGPVKSSSIRTRRKL